MDTTPRQENPSTYFVQDRSNKEEMLRLRLQDQMVTLEMGGVLSEQPDPARFESVLDVGCGTGGWLIETAKAYPTIAMLRGVDISERMVKYARAQAEEQHVSERVEFHVMDALRALDFPDQQFDLVNMRFAASWLRTWDWSKILDEYRRVCRPDGVIRITDANAYPENTSPALNELFDLVIASFFQSGHLFTPEGNGLISQFPRLLQQQGFQHIQTRTLSTVYRAGTSEWQGFAEDIQRVFQTGAPFLRKWARVPDDYETLYQQAMEEIRDPTFVSKGEVVTVWGIR